MGFDSNSARPGDRGPTAQATDLGQAIENDVLPTLLKRLARDSSRLANEIAPAALSVVSGQNIDQSTGQSTSQTSDSRMTWVESLVNERNLQSNEVTVKPSKVKTRNWVSPEEFATMVLNESDEALLKHCTQLKAQGVPDEVLLLDLLAPTSAELGRRWERDENDFADVTIGVCRLHQILRSLHPQHLRSLDQSAHGGRALLTTVPGEQHSFGLLLVGELLFGAGWYTDVDIDPQTSRLKTKVKSNWYELAGISVGCETLLKNTKALIADIRTHSCNPDIAIVVGGYLVDEHPDLYQQLGADQPITRKEDVASAVSRFIPTQSRI